MLTFPIPKNKYKTENLFESLSAQNVTPEEKSSSPERDEFFELFFTEGSTPRHSLESLLKHGIFSMEAVSFFSVQSPSLSSSMSSPRFSVLSLEVSPFTRKKDVSDRHARVPKMFGLTDENTLESLDYEGPYSSSENLQSLTRMVFEERRNTLEREISKINSKIEERDAAVRFIKRLEEEKSEALQRYINIQSEIASLEHMLREVNSGTGKSSRSKKERKLENKKNKKGNPLIAQKDRLNSIIHHDRALMEISNAFQEINSQTKKMPDLKRDLLSLQEKMKIINWSEEFLLLDEKSLRVSTTNTVPLIDFMTHINQLDWETRCKLLHLCATKEFELMYAFLAPHYNVSDHEMVQVRIRHRNIRQPHPTLLGGFEPEITTAGTFDVVIREEDGHVVISEIRADSGHFRPEASASIDILTRYFLNHFPKRFRSENLKIRSYEGDESLYGRGLQPFLFFKTDSNISISSRDESERDNTLQPFSNF